MTQRAKLIAKITSGQAVSFDALHQLLLSEGFAVTVAGSHHTYRKGKIRLTIPRHGKDVKMVYLKQVAEVFRDEV